MRLFLHGLEDSKQLQSTPLKNTQVVMWDIFLPQEKMAGMLPTVG
jgi:hypothetical protein